MATNSELAKEAILEVLADSAIPRVSFNFGQWSIDQALFKSVAEAVKAGTIVVTYTTKYPGRAFYYGGADEFLVGLTSSNDKIKNALIVHESVHAGFDIKNLSKMRVAVSEAAAYVAQCAYARYYLEDPKDPDFRLSSDDEDRDWVFDIGWKLAGKVLTSKKIEAADYKDMVRAVEVHPDYTNTADPAGWDGMKRAKKK